MFGVCTDKVLLVDSFHSAGEDEQSVQREQGVPRPSQEEPGEEGEWSPGGKQGAHFHHEGEGGGYWPKCQTENQQPWPNGGDSRSGSYLNPNYLQL